MLENILTEQQLRKELNLSRSTLYRYKTQLQLPFSKIGAKSFYNVEDVKQFLNNHRSTIKLNGRK
jgi:predicted DNA-binding transcriptional regulator AlpA